MHTMHPHNTEIKHNKNCLQCGFCSTAGSGILHIGKINLVQYFTKQNETNENNLQNAIYKKINRFLFHSSEGNQS